MAILCYGSQYSALILNSELRNSTRSRNKPRHYQCGIRNLIGWHHFHIFSLNWADDKKMLLWAALDMRTDTGHNLFSCWKDIGMRGFHIQLPLTQRTRKRCKMEFWYHSKFKICCSDAKNMQKGGKSRGASVIFSTLYHLMRNFSDGFLIPENMIYDIVCESTSIPSENFILGSLII